MNYLRIVPVVVTLALICVASIISFLEIGLSEVTITLKVENKGVTDRAAIASTLRSRINADDDVEKQPTLPVFKNPNTVYLTHTDASELFPQGHDSLSGKQVCETFLRSKTIEEYKNHPTVFNVSLNCFDLLGDDKQEPGNLISAFYAIRLVARALGKTDLAMQCKDADEEHTAGLILPWIMGVFPRSSPGSLAAKELPAVTDLCSDETKVPIAAMWRSVRFELRRMAISMVGIPSASHPSAKWAVENLWSEKKKTRHRHDQDYLQLPHLQPGELPLYNNDIQLDEAILNFQCPHSMDSTQEKNGDYYFMKLRSYSRHLSRNVKTIGITTHVFDDSTSATQKGHDDNNAQQHCKTLLDALVDHLKERFPKAQISIYSDEASALTLARMIMAKQVFVGITPFGLLPTVATFGTAYVPVSDDAKGANQWLQTSFSVLKKLELKLVEEPMLSAFEVNALWKKGSAVMEWFLTYNARDNFDDPIADATSTGGGEGEEEHLPELLTVANPETTTIFAYHNNTGLRSLAFDFFKGVTCQLMLGNDTSFAQHATHPTLVDISFGCLDLFKYSEFGTGNYITAFYAIRMAARAMGKTDVVISCHDAEEMKDSLILPWMMGIFPALPPGDPELDEQPTPEDACSNFGDASLGWVAKEMVFELRRMAISMVGIPSPDHPSAAWAEENLWSNPSISHSYGRNYMQLPHPKKGDAPLFPGTQIDDVAIHFRCGDIVSSKHGSFGFMKFGSYSRHLSPNVRSIGIVTQPFEAAAQQRNAEGGEFKRQRCRRLVGAFVDHLQEKFPNAKISIHNDVNETIALTFARLIMANETVIGITSFGVFPGISTFGTGYIREPDYAKAPNKWLLKPPLLQRLDNVKLIKEPVLIAPAFDWMWSASDGRAAIEWCANYTRPAWVKGEANW